MEGDYDIFIHAVDLENGGYFSSRCEEVTIAISVLPVINPTCKLTDICHQSTNLNNQMKYDEITRGNLSYTVNTPIVDTTYITLQDFFSPQK